LPGRVITNPAVRARAATGSKAGRRTARRPHPPRSTTVSARTRRGRPVGPWLPTTASRTGRRDVRCPRRPRN